MFVLTYLREVKDKGLKQRYIREVKITRLRLQG